MDTVQPELQPCRKKRYRVLFVLQRDSKFPSSACSTWHFAWKKNSPFCKKRAISFSHEHMAQICKTPNAFCAECNSSSTDLSHWNKLWSYWAQTVPFKSWQKAWSHRGARSWSTGGGEQWCEVRNESQVTPPVSDFYNFALSTMKPNKTR